MGYLPCADAVSTPANYHLKLRPSRFKASRGFIF
jgi:hypothetical protein